MRKTKKHFVPRLFVAAELAKEKVLTLDVAQSHYVLNVMRSQQGDKLLLFNGKDGEWSGDIVASKPELKIALTEKTQPQTTPIDLCLLFAPLRGQRSAWIAQKAAELGVKTLQPILTARTIARSVKLEKLRANAIEGAEQSESLFVPDIKPLVNLDEALEKMEKARCLIFCDEALKSDHHAARAGAPLQHLSALRGYEKFAILIGPEGGWTLEERQRVQAHSSSHPLRLGGRVLRAETAILAAVILFQTIIGDWQE